MRRDAFTLPELIFVLILVGVLGTAALSLTRPDRLRVDAEHIRTQLMKSRYEAIGYDHRNFDASFVASGAPGCLTLDRASLEGNLSRAGAYRLDVRTVVSVSGLTGNTICFDEKGRPHDGDFTLSTLLQRKVDIIVSDGRKSLTVTVYPVSGFVASAQ